MQVFWKKCTSKTYKVTHMSGYIRLSELIDEIKRLPIPEHDDVIERAAAIHILHYPYMPPQMLNVATLALLMDRLQVYEVLPGAISPPGYLGNIFAYITCILRPRIQCVSGEFSRGPG